MSSICRLYGSLMGSVLGTERLWSVTLGSRPGFLLNIYGYRKAQSPCRDMAGLFSRARLWVCVTLHTLSSAYELTLPQAQDPPPSLVSVSMLSRVYSDCSRNTSSVMALDIEACVLSDIEMLEHSWRQVCISQSALVVSHAQILNKSPERRH